MFIIRWATKLVDTVNSWEEGIALSVMIMGGGCGLILLIFVYSHLYQMFYPNGTNHQPKSATARIAINTPPAPRGNESYCNQFGRPRDLDARGSEARAAGVIPQ